jgi:hypothetical protein
MEWLDSNIIMTIAAFLGLVLYLAQESFRVRGTFSGKRLGTMRVPKVDFSGRSARMRITVRRRAGGGVRIIMGSHLSPLDTLELTGGEVSRFADSLERAAAEHR